MAHAPSTLFDLVQRPSLNLRRPSPYLLLTLTALFWSGNFVVGRGIQGAVPPITLAFGRWAIALCVLLPFAWRALVADRAAIARHWKVMALLGVLGVAVFNTFVYVGLGSTSATNGLLLNSSIPVLIVAIGWLFLGMQVSALQALGIAVSLLGIGAIIFRGDIAGLLSLEFTSGDLWVFAAMLDWAVYTLLLRRRPQGVSPLSLLAVTMAFGLAAITPFFIGEVMSGARIELRPASFGALAYVGLFPSLIAYLFWNRAVAEVGASRSGIFIHLMPVFGTLLAIVFLGESFHGYHAIGITLILVGIVLATRERPA